MNRLTTLILDGNQEIRDQLQKYLEAADTITSVVIKAGSLSQCEQLLPHHEIDVVLLNSELPDSQGFNTLRTVIASVPEAAIIIIANSREQEDIASLFLRYGAQDFLEYRNLSTSSLQRSVLYGVDRKRFLQEKNDLLLDLNDALDKIGDLETYLPICCGCSKILGEDDKWHNLKSYRGKVAVRESDLLLCPSCTTTTWAKD